MLDFIVNPHVKNIRAILAEITDRLNAECVPFEFHMGENKKETRDIVRRITESGVPVTVVVVGGDGTLNDVISGMVCPENVTLGLIPVGTGNDFAATAKIPENVSAALDLILHGEAKYTDYIECEDGLRSFNIAGLGIDVDILERCYRMKRGGKKSKYFRSLLASLAKYKGQKIEITVNGERFSKTALIAAVCNGRQFGGGIPICPPASLDDGKLDLVVADCPKRIKIPFLLLKLMKGKILSCPIAQHTLCEEVKIVQVEGNTVELDGELVTSRTLTARVVSGKLKMFRG